MILMLENGSWEQTQCITLRLACITSQFRCFVLEATTLNWKERWQVMACLYFHVDSSVIEVLSCKLLVYMAARRTCVHSYPLVDFHSSHIFAADPSLDVSQLHESLAEYSEINPCGTATDANGNSPLAYVQFRLEEDAKRVMDELIGAHINGWSIQVELSKRQNLEEDLENKKERQSQLYIKRVSHQSSASWPGLPLTILVMKDGDASRHVELMVSDDAVSEVFSVMKGHAEVIKPIMTSRCAYSVHCSTQAMSNLIQQTRNNGDQSRTELA